MSHPRLLGSILIGSALLAAPAFAADPGEPTPLGPPDARPGQCFARVTLPARTETYQEQVLVEGAREEKRVIPARTQTRTKQVVVREERRRTVVEPPVYDTVTETVVVRPGYERTEVTPAQTRRITERVVEPPRRVWKLVRSPLQPTVIWCLVEEPGRTRTVSRTVVVKPESVRRTPVAPEYASVPREVLRRPATTREIVEPAVVKQVTTQEVVEPSRVEVIRTPARYAAVPRTRTLEPERREWVRVLCETEADPARIRSIQKALKARGFYRGEVDGVYGPATADAVQRFQRAKGLAHEGYLSHPTLEALAVAPPPPAYPPRADRG